MEKKSNNGMIIILMGVIIVILAVLCVLFATGKLSLNHELDKGFNSKDEGQIVPNEEKSNVLTNQDAVAVVRDLFTNETVRRIMDNPQLTFCSSSDDKMYTENELGLDYQWNGLYKCKEFRSYDELVNYFKTFFVDNYYKNNIENKYTIATKFQTTSEGTVMYNYYEKGGSLYYAISGKGSNMDKLTLLNVDYDVTNITETEIMASVNATWRGADDTSEAIEAITIKLEKEEDVWKIALYDVK